MTRSQTDQGQINNNVVIDHLFVIESPNKRERVLSYIKNNPLLNGNCDVVATVGHILSLSKSYSISSYDDPKWVFGNKSKQVTLIKSMVKRSKHIYLATDPDLAGEFIAWSVMHVCGLSDDRCTRVVFHSITSSSVDSSIRYSLEKQSKIDMNKVYAEQTRILLDHLIGFTLSPMVIKTTAGRSAGRCQSPITKLVCNRDSERNTFQPKPVFRIRGVFSYRDTNGHMKTIDGTLTGAGVNEIDQTGGEVILNSFPRTDRYVISNVTSSSHTQQPPYPYKTSTVLSDISQKTGMSVKQITSSLQTLFSKGFITYIRTKSSKVDRGVIPVIQKTISGLFGSDVIHPERGAELGMDDRSVSEKRKGKREQESHECIRVTDPNEMGDSVPNKVRNVYRCIWRRSLASFMKPCYYKTYHISISPEVPNNIVFVANEKHVTDMGFRVVYDEPPTNRPTQPFITMLQKIVAGDSPNQPVVAEQISCTETIPNSPCLFTESSLITKMESMNIGTEATYASIVSKLLDRRYIAVSSSDGNPITLTTITLLPNTGVVNVSHKNVLHGSYKKRLVSTDLGRKVTHLLETNVSDIMRYDYTSGLEKHIIQVEKGERSWKEVVLECFETLRLSMEKWRESYTGPEKRTVTTSYGPVCVYDGKHSPVIQWFVKPPQDTGKRVKAGVKQYTPLPNKHDWRDVSAATVERLIDIHYKNQKDGMHLNMTYKECEYTVIVKKGIKNFGPYLALHKPTGDSKPILKRSIHNIPLKKWIKQNTGIDVFSVDRSVVQSILDT